MPKFPSLTAKKLISFLKKQGFGIDHTSGSHMILYRSTDKKRTTVPFHTKDLPKGTIFAILREAGYSRNDYLKITKKNK